MCVSSTCGYLCVCVRAHLPCVGICKAWVWIMPQVFLLVDFLNVQGLPFITLQQDLQKGWASMPREAESGDSKEGWGTVYQHLAQAPTPRTLVHHVAPDLPCPEQHYHTAKSCGL